MPDELSRDPSPTYSDEEEQIDDEPSPFFAFGRELESATTNHRFSAKERKLLAKHQSIDYFPPNSELYKQQIASRARRGQLQRWLLMGLIGFSVGCLSFFVKNVVGVLNKAKYSVASRFIEEDRMFAAWLWVAGYSIFLVILSSSVVVFFRPSAAGSGIPEVIAYLNGANLRRIFNIKTLATKLTSVIFAVGSGACDGVRPLLASIL